jgi:hypothetical protein
VDIDVAQHLHLCINTLATRRSIEALAMAGAVKRSLSIGDRRASVDPSADAALAKMGYASELPRNLSMLSVLGL